MRSLIDPIPRRIYRPPRIIIRFCCDIRPAWRICLCCDVRLACSIFPPPRRAPPLASNDVGRRVQRPWFTHAPTSNRKLLPGRKLQSSGYLWGGNLRTHCATSSNTKHAQACKGIRCSAQSLTGLVNSVLIKHSSSSPCQNLLEPKWLQI